MSQIKGRCTFFFLLLKSKLCYRHENKLDIFKITLPNINFEAFNHQDKVDGGVNGGVNNGLDDWISEIVNELPRGKPRGIKCAQLRV